MQFQHISTFGRNVPRFRSHLSELWDRCRYPASLAPRPYPQVLYLNQISLFLHFNNMKWTLVANEWWRNFNYFIIYCIQCGLPGRITLFDIFMSNSNEIDFSQKKKKKSKPDCKQSFQYPIPDKLSKDFRYWL